MRRIRKGDKVRVRTGKDKGRVGTVLSVLKKSDQESDLWVIVEGINLIKKHVKANPQKQQSGGIVTRETPMRACKVALFDPTTNKGGRVGVRLTSDGTKVRYFKSSNEVIDV